MTPRQLANETPAFRLGYWHGFMGRAPSKQNTDRDARDYVRGWAIGAAAYRRGN